MRAALALAVLLAAPGAAQAEFLSSDTCRASWDRLQAVVPATTGSVKTASQVWLRAGFCSLDGVEIAPEGQYQPGFRIAKVSWRAEGLQAFLDTGKPPQSLDLKIEDLRITIKTGNGVMDYLMRAQNDRNGIDADLSLHWEAGDKRLVLDRLDVDFPGANAIRATASVDRVDLSSQSAAQVSLGAMGLTDLSVEVTSNGLFESYVLMPLGTVILGQAADPEAALKAFVTKAQAFVLTLPDVTFPGPTKQAITALLADMPNPAGNFGLTLHAPGGIGAARFARYAVTGLPTSADAMGPLFDGVTVTATYLPTPAGAE
jgi:hypothetical protein